MFRGQHPHLPLGEGDDLEMLVGAVETTAVPRGDEVDHHGDQEHVPVEVRAAHVAKVQKSERALKGPRAKEEPVQFTRLPQRSGSLRLWLEGSRPCRCPRRSTSPHHPC